MLVIETPTKLRLEGYKDKIDELKKFLTFTDNSIIYEIQRFKKQVWFVNKYGREAYEEKLSELKSQQKICLLEEDGNNLYTFSGLVEDLACRFNDIIKNEIEYPKYQLIPWDKEPNFKLRPYQIEAIKLLLEKKHGGVSLPTGSGKSACILHLVKSLCLKTVIMAPSVSIANQLYELFEFHLGKKYVGYFGNGKKRTDKLFTIGIAQSLTRVKINSKEWDELSKAQIFVVDESHLCPAATLKKVCMGLLGNASYRFFFSATQMRNDGADLLLKAIIGPIVLSISTTKMIEDKYLAKPNFIIIRSQSPSNYISSDVLKMLSHHLYNNPLIHKQVAELANNSVKLLNHKVLILIDHIEQFQYLLPHFRFQVEFAHSGVTAKNKIKIDSRYHKSDPTKLVDRFNKGEIPILVATSCIGTGTDIRPVNTIFNIQGGKSEIKFMQIVGRGTRLSDGKTEFNFVDYDILNVPMIHNHTKSRINIYKKIYNNVKYL